MRHRKRRSKLSMMTARRNATMRNMAKSLLKYQKIETTLARAKEVRRLVEHLITVSKDNSVTARRRAYMILNDRDQVANLFNVISPLFKSRSSGYTRIIPLKFRRGDGATIAILELTEKSVIEKLPKAKKEKAKAKPEEAPAKEAKAQEKAAEKEKAEAKREEKHKPTVAEGKRTEKAKSEDKKIEGKKAFMKNLRGFFRRKSDM